MTKAEVVPLLLIDTKEISTSYPSIKKAQEILGKGKIFPLAEVAKAWRIEDVRERIIPFKTETLEWCAKENVAMKADWRLVYDLGQNMSEMLSERGEGGKGQPCFHPTYHYYPEYKKTFPELNHMHKYYEDVNPWIVKKRGSNYRLIDFNARFKGMTFTDQERCIRGLGSKFIRTSAPIFAEVVMSMFMLSGERIAQDWYHWAPEKHMWGGYHVAIGRFIPHGLAIMPGYEGAGHGVVVSRESDL